MRKNIFYLVLIIMMSFCSISVISAADCNVDLNQIECSFDLDDISHDSKIYSINNININQTTDSSMIGEENKISTHFNASDVELYFRNGTRFEGWLLDNQNNPIVGQNVTITINKVHYTKITGNDGNFSIAIDLNSGNYSVGLKYAGTEDYKGCEHIGFAKVFPVISGEDVVKYYRNGTQYYATFLDGHGNPLANTTIKFNINGVFYVRETNESGVAKLTIDLFPKTYIITAYHPNGYKYSNIITVLSTIEGNNLTKGFRDNEQYYATLLDDQGQPLADVNATFNINGVFYTKPTNGSGVAKLNIYLFPKIYIITVIHPNGLQYSNIIEVKSGLETYIVPENNSITEESYETINVTLYNELGHKVPDKTINLIIDDKLYSSTTDSEGLATFSPYIAAGNYDVVYNFKGDDYYSNSTINGSTIVKDGIITCFEVPENIIVRNNSFGIIVKDLGGNPLSDINLYFTINGIKYSRITDSDGIARINLCLNPNIYPISYTINQERHKRISNTANVTVIITNETNFLDYIKYYVQGQNLSFKLLAGNIPIVNQSVSIEVNGNKFNSITNSKGIANFNAGLGIGEYNITCLFDGNNVLKNSTNIFNITVKESIATKIEAVGSLILYEDLNSTFDVKLIDVENNVGVANKEIVVLINGTNYYAVTDLEGIARVNANVTRGNYKISFVFNKTEDYQNCSGSADIKIIYFGLGAGVSKSTVIYLDCDNIHGKSTDKKMLEDCAQALRQQGYTVVNLNNVGPNYHVSDLLNTVPKNSCLFTIFGGLCAGTFVDMASRYYKNAMTRKNVTVVLGFLAPPVKDDLDTLTWLKRSWDDDFSPASFKGLENPGQYLKDNGFTYIYGISGTDLGNKFVEGGGGLGTLA